MTTNSKAQTDFEYGWCHTDVKDGRKIRRDFRTKDYFNDEPYAGRVRRMLQKLGLPMPAPEEIFRGTHHDLLFLNSHGVVLRIGPLDVSDLMNPGILQPLGWIEDRDSPMRDKTFLTVALYPGVELHENFLKGRGKAHAVTGVMDFLWDTGHETYDCATRNMGFIRVPEDTAEEKEEIGVEVMIDIDNTYNYSRHKLAKKRRAHRKCIDRRLKNNADVMAHTLSALFGDAAEAGPRLRAFETHQPLRHLFWKAFQGMDYLMDEPDYKKRAAFWRACAEGTGAPRGAFTRCWRPGTMKNGKKTLVPEKTFIPGTTLHRQWAKDPADDVNDDLPPQAQKKSAPRQAVAV